MIELYIGTLLISVIKTFMLNTSLDKTIDTYR